MERASVDEAYLDITQIVDDKLSKEIFEHEAIIKQLGNSYIVGFSESSVNDEGLSFNFSFTCNRRTIQFI